MSQRTERFAHSIQHELVELMRDVKDARVQAATLVTVTHVRVSDDFGVASVQVSVIVPEGSERASDQRLLGDNVLHLCTTERFSHSRLFSNGHVLEVHEYR